MTEKEEKFINDFVDIVSSFTCNGINVGYVNKIMRVMEIECLCHGDRAVIAVDNLRSRFTELTVDKDGNW